MSEQKEEYSASNIQVLEGLVHAANTDEVPAKQLMNGVEQVMKRK